MLPLSGRPGTKTWLVSPPSSFLSIYRYHFNLNNSDPVTQVLFMGACMKPPHLAIVTSLCKVRNSLLCSMHHWSSLIIGWRSLDGSYRLLSAFYHINYQLYFVSLISKLVLINIFIWSSTYHRKDCIYFFVRATLSTHTCTCGGTSSTWTRWQRKHNNN